MMNEKLKEILANIFAYSIIGYIFISLFFAILLLIYNFISVPLAKFFLSQDVSAHNYFVQQINSSNISPSEKAYLLESANQISMPVNLLPINQSQFIEDELILIVPPAILLGLIYYLSKKENYDE